MQAGKLRHRVIIESAVVSQDSFGGETTTWSAAGTVWASVEPLRGREYLEAKQQQIEVSTRIRMRYRAGVTSGMRLRWTNPDAVVHVFEVVDVIHDATHLRQMELMCVEDV